MRFRKCFFSSNHWYTLSCFYLSIWRDGRIIVIITILVILVLRTSLKMSFIILSIGKWWNLHNSAILEFFLIITDGASTIVAIIVFIIFVEMQMVMVKLKAGFCVEFFSTIFAYFYEIYFFVPLFLQVKIIMKIHFNNFSLVAIVARHQHILIIISSKN